jgi:dienelactone hydrolase
MRAGLKVSLLLALVCSLQAQTPTRYAPTFAPAQPADIPYSQYITRDKFNRRIVFYVAGVQRERLPLVLVILGSGQFSNFRREGERIVDAHGTVRAAFAGNAHIVVVEKPGVEFLQQPARGDEQSLRGSPAFQSENTLPRWVEAVSAALRAARKLPQMDPRRTLLIGHSEGVVVAALAAKQNSFVTHIASLAGNGPSITFELEAKAREGRLYPDLAGDGPRQLERLYADLKVIRHDPKSASRLAIGHTHIYWSSRLKASNMDTLARSQARIFLAHGTADRNVAFQNFQLMSELLKRRKRNLTEMIVEGADHGFRVAARNGQPARDAWGEVIARLSQWFATTS